MVLGLAVVGIVGWIALVVVKRSRDVAADERREQDESRRIRAVARRVDARPGGAADRPLCVASPAEIEPRVERDPCPWCGGSAHVEAHEVEERGADLLRRVTTKCGSCSQRLVTWFRVESVLPN